MDEVRDIPELKGIIDSAILPMFTTTGGRLVVISTPPESPLHHFTSAMIPEAQSEGSFCPEGHAAAISALLLNPTYRQALTAD